MERRGTSTPACLKSLIRSREQQIAILQLDLESIRRTLEIVLQDSSASGRMPTIRQQPKDNTSKQNKVAMLADELATYVRSKQGTLITPTEAQQHLLSQGLTTEKSKQFHAWHALTKTGIFTRVSRGKYQLVDDGTESDAG